MPRRKIKLEYVPGSQPDQLHGAFDLLLLDRQAGGCSAYTLRFYRQQLLPFFDWLLAHNADDPRNITVALIQQFTVECFAKAKPSTRRAANVAIRSYLRFCADPERGIIDRVPNWRLPRASTDSVDRPFVTAEDVQKVLHVCKSLQEQCLVAVLADSGIRRCEAAPLKWSNVNLETGKLTIRHGKGNKNRAAFVGDMTVDLLRQLEQTEPHGADDPVFTDRSGEALEIPALSRRLERLGQRASVRLSSHRLRRTYGVLSTVNGMNVFALQDTMGHANIEQTRQYVKLATEHLQAAHRAASPIDHLNGNSK